MGHCQQMLCSLKKTNKTLRETLYFTGVPIEGEVNKVFVAMSSLHLDIAEYIRQKHFGKPFTLQVCL